MHTPEREAVLLENLNAAQMTAVTHTEGPLLIVAGAGTGKTTVIARRIAWLMEVVGCDPEAILALTFTEKAASEMEERVDRLVPYGYAPLWISTFHAFCERILRAHAFDIGLPYPFKLLDRTSTWLLMRKNLARFDLAYYRPLGNPTKFLHALIQHISRLKDEAIAPRDYIRHATARSSGEGFEIDLVRGSGDEASRVLELAHAYDTYEQILLENGYMDFGGLLLQAVRLLEERPAILEKYREQFTYILVDEFQDTNPIQYRLVKLLAGPRNNITVVGDDDQAIYRFRGASLANILQFKKDFAGSKEVVLTHNYRSRQGILDLSYSFIQSNNPHRLECTLEGGAEGISKQLKSANDEKASIRHIHSATHEEEAVSVVDEIEKRCKEDETLSWWDFAILVRANDSSAPFIAALQSRGIPYYFFALRGLYEKPLITDVLAYLRCVTQPQNSIYLYRVLSLPVVSVQGVSLGLLMQYAHKNSVTLWDACLACDSVEGLSDDDNAALKSITALISGHAQEARTATPQEIFVGFLTASQYLDHIMSLPEAVSIEQCALLEQFLKKMRTLQEETPNAHLADFLEMIELELEAGEHGALPSEELDTDTVKIMSIHSSKGLEFPYVFVVHCVDKRFPTIPRSDSIELPAGLVSEPPPTRESHLEEERRLMYVAITRAKRGVYFTSAESYGGARAKKLSKFLDEMGFVKPDTVPTSPSDASHNNLRTPVKEGKVESASPANPLPSVFSYTQLSSFRTCPLQYKFAFIIKIPVPGKGALTFGKTMHATLQVFMEQWKEKGRPVSAGFAGSGDTSYTTSDELPTLENLLKIYAEKWSDEWYGTPHARDEYRDRGVALLTRWYEGFAKKPPKVFGVEKDFILKIGPYSLKGRIDRIDEDASGVTIVDYKTGTPKKEDALALPDKEQLILYQIASEEIFKKSVVALQYQYLEDGSSIEFLATPQEKERVETRVRETIQELVESDFAPTPGFMCRYCDFKDICDFRQD